MLQHVSLPICVSLPLGLLQFFPDPLRKFGRPKSDCSLNVKAWNQASGSHFVNMLWSHTQNSCHLRNFQSLVPLFQHLDEFHGPPAFEEPVSSLQKHLHHKDPVLDTPLPQYKNEYLDTVSKVLWCGWSSDPRRNCAARPIRTRRNAKSCVNVHISAQPVSLAVGYQLQTWESALRAPALLVRTNGLNGLRPNDIHGCGKSGIVEELRTTARYMLLRFMNAQSATQVQPRSWRKRALEAPT